MKTRILRETGEKIVLANFAGAQIACDGDGVVLDGFVGSFAPGRAKVRTPTLLTLV